MLRQCSTWFLLAVLVLASQPTSAFAHNVGVDCTLRGDKVEVETFYDDDTPAIKAKISVVNAKDEVVAAGVTDANGRWSFAAPIPGKYEVRADAGAGHRAKTTINIPGASAAPTAGTVNEGRKRAEITGFPWLNVLLGLTIIGGCGAAFLIASYRRRNQESARADS